MCGLEETPCQNVLRGPARPATCDEPTLQTNSFGTPVKRWYDLSGAVMWCFHIITVATRQHRVTTSRTDEVAAPTL